MKKLLLLVGFVVLSGCIHDNNEKAEYGDTGLAKNCRAFVQVSVNSYRNNEYPVNEVFDALERNCGANGWLWSK